MFVFQCFIIYFSHWQFDVNLTVSNPVIEAQLSVLVNGVPIKNAKNTKGNNTLHIHVLLLL